MLDHRIHFPVESGLSLFVGHPRLEILNLKTVNLSDKILSTTTTLLSLLSLPLPVAIVPDCNILFSIKGI